MPEESRKGNIKMQHPFLEINLLHISKECLYLKRVGKKRKKELCFLLFSTMQHPVGELILQALEAHKKKHSTGSKTLLYLTTHLSKVVSQLRSLVSISCHSFERDLFLFSGREGYAIVVKFSEHFFVAFEYFSCIQI